jgi:hypothetical protein
MVGSSFGHLPARIMIEGNCLARFRFYYYLILGRFGGTPIHELQRNLVDSDLTPLRDAKVMILEENESFVDKAGYIDPLRALVRRF